MKGRSGRVLGGGGGTILYDTIRFVLARVYRGRSRWLHRALRLATVTLRDDQLLRTNNMFWWALD